MSLVNVCKPINSEKEFEKILKAQDKFFILFYAGWCPFCQEFLPVFEKCLKDKDSKCYRMMADEYPSLCDKYSVDVFPTVLFFQKGKVSKRLDGIGGVGLSEEQFRDLVHICSNS